MPSKNCLICLLGLKGERFFPFTLIGFKFHSRKKTQTPKAQEHLTQTPETPRCDQNGTILHELFHIAAWQERDEGSADCSSAPRMGHTPCKCRCRAEEMSNDLAGSSCWHVGCWLIQVPCGGKRREGRSVSSHRRQLAEASASHLTQRQRSRDHRESPPGPSSPLGFPGMRYGCDGSRTREEVDRYPSVKKDGCTCCKRFTDKARSVPFYGTS